MTLHIFDCRRSLHNYFYLYVKCNPRIDVQPRGKDGKAPCVPESINPLTIAGWRRRMPPFSSRTSRRHRRPDWTTAHPFFLLLLINRFRVNGEIAVGSLCTPSRFCPHAFVNQRGWASEAAPIVQTSHAIELELKIHKLPPENVKWRQKAPFKRERLTFCPLHFRYAAVWQLAGTGGGVTMQCVSIVQTHR